MLKIRLTRVGKKNTPVYRVVVAEQKKAVQRKFIEILGYYHPADKPKQIVIDKEKALSWISKGAQPSDTVNNLLCDLGIFPQSKKIKKVFAKKNKKKDEAKAEQPEVKKPETAEKVEDEGEAPVTAEEAESTEEVSPAPESEENPAADQK